MVAGVARTMALLVAVEVQVPVGLAGQVVALEVARQVLALTGSVVEAREHALQPPGTEAARHLGEEVEGQPAVAHQQPEELEAHPFMERRAEEELAVSLRPIRNMLEVQAALCQERWQAAEAQEEQSVVGMGVMALPQANIAALVGVGEAATVAVQVEQVAQAAHQVEVVAEVVAAQP